MTGCSNRYCQRLRIPIPTVESAAAQPAVNLFLLMMVTLLERGSPMSFDQIVARLDRGQAGTRRAGGVAAVVRHGATRDDRETPVSFRQACVSA